MQKIPNIYLKYKNYLKIILKHHIKRFSEAFFIFHLRIFLSIYNFFNYLKIILNIQSIKK